MKKTFISILKNIRLYDIARKSVEGLKTTRNVFLRTVFPSMTILLYHRVADVTDDPHQLAVSVAHFREQMQFLKKTCTIIPLREMAERVKTGRIQNGAVAISFDDGYRDNVTNALPILEEFHIPATIFVTTGKINSDEPFYEHEDTQKNDQGVSMNSDELARLAKSPCIEIGAHTVHHPLLSSLSSDQQREEIVESKKTLETIISAPVTAFAYPYGSPDAFSDETVDIVRGSGFTYACANIHTRVFSFSPLFALPRIIARDWNAVELKAHIDHS